MLSRNRLCLLDVKIRKKSPVHIFDLNCFDSMVHTIVLQASVLSVLISVAEVLRKNYLLSYVLFFTDSVLFYLFAVLQPLSFFFFARTLGIEEKQYTFLKIFIFSRG